MRYVIDLISSWGRSYGKVATLALMYIQEAHAVDEWPINSNRLSKKGLNSNSTVTEGLPVCYRQHQSIEERVQAATDFVTDYDVPVIKDDINTTHGSVYVLADNIQNNFQTVYACWPIRWMVFKLFKLANGQEEIRITNIGEPDGASFDMYIVNSLLEELATIPVVHHE